jgi:hypothetical protein
MHSSRSIRHRIAVVARQGYAFHRHPEERSEEKSLPAGCDIQPAPSLQSLHG